jgi:hypothetical protein
MKASVAAPASSSLDLIEQAGLGVHVDHEVVHGR